MRTFNYIASGLVVGCSMAIATSAIAGGFAIREQSTTGLGKAFADSAAGSDLSSMFWNPAAVTTQDGLNSLSAISLIIPDTEITPVGGNGTDMDTLGLLAGSYYNYQFNQQVYLGLSINAPFGLVTDANNNTWAGAQGNRRSEILTLNAAPTIGVKITPNFSLAAGVQIQYINVRLEQAIGAPVGPSGVIKGDDVGFGFTLGALYKTDSGTSVGIGYRSEIAHSLAGTTHVTGLAPLTATRAALTTPEMVTVSVRQKLTDSIAVMANYEWSGWSSLSQLVVTPGFGGGPNITEAFGWKDSWFASVGAEMKMNDKMTIRTGLGYEQTPVPALTRGVRLPDSDRIWLNFGGSYAWSEATTLDFGYSHIFFEDTNISPVHPFVPNAAVENSANIISVGFRTKFH